MRPMTKNITIIGLMNEDGPGLDDTWLDQYAVPHPARSMVLRMPS